MVTQQKGDSHQRRLAALAAAPAVENASSPRSSTSVPLPPAGPQRDEFFIYHLKVDPCPRRCAHDWAACPLAHPAEKAKRRDPRKHAYAGVACPFMKQNGSCPLGEACPNAHNAWEFWLHPTRYRTTLCEKGSSCSRRFCFFAHRSQELRPLQLAPAAPAALDLLAQRPAAASQQAGPQAAMSPQQPSTPSQGTRGTMAPCYTYGQLPDSAGWPGDIMPPPLALTGSSSLPAAAAEPEAMWSSMLAVLGGVWAPRPPQALPAFAGPQAGPQGQGWTSGLHVAQAPQPSLTASASSRTGSDWADGEAGAVVQAVVGWLGRGTIDATQAASLLNRVLPDHALEQLRVLLAIKQT